MTNKKGKEINLDIIGSLLANIEMSAEDTVLIIDGMNKLNNLDYNLFSGMKSYFEKMCENECNKEISEEKIRGNGIEIFHERVRQLVSEKD